MSFSFSVGGKTHLSRTPPTLCRETICQMLQDSLCWRREWHRKVPSIVWRQSAPPRQSRTPRSVWYSDNEIQFILHFHEEQTKNWGNENDTELMKWRQECQKSVKESQSNRNARELTLNDPYTSSADVMMSEHKQQVTMVRKSESSVGEKARARNSWKVSAFHWHECRSGSGNRKQYHYQHK